MASQANRGVPLSTLCPKFLHSNSTSHTWPFSAIAELVDNAYDPDVKAKQFWIDRTEIKGEECLSFMDNGNGLNNETMHKMLSFGYSDKVAANGVEPIGIYGNGFKSGSMRLGRDAIVFSKSKMTSCVGMLSQTYLEHIGATQIIVPIVSFEEKGNKYMVKEEHKASLQDILRYSPFNTEAELLAEIQAIGSHQFQTKATGTRIIIWNLRRTTSGTTEFDFGTDRYDVRIPSDVYEELNSDQNTERARSYIPESEFSLRAYCSILYLKPRMQIIIRGQKVKSQLIAKSLAHIRKDHYKPIFLNKRIPITFGYNTKSKDQYGVMMYHKNRLIKAYERVGCQIKANNKGVGVIGVIECNFLEPTHNKQNFMENDKYRKTITSLCIKLEEYWNEIRHVRNREDPDSTIPLEDTMKRPDQNWVQCDDCLQWRKLPDGIDFSRLPDKWFCRMNPDPHFRSCHVPEEPEDSDDDQPSYRKTYKQQEREDRKKQEMNKQNDVTQLVQSPSTKVNLERQGGPLRVNSTMITSLNSSQVACCPSSNDGLPVISNVCSLSEELSRRMKRIAPVNPQMTPKRPRVNGIQSRTLNRTAPALMSTLNPSSPLTTTHEQEDSDDIVILENESTPVPTKPSIEIRNIKTEAEQRNSSDGLLMECSDDAAVDVTSEIHATANQTVTPSGGAGPSQVLPVSSRNITTQTEQPIVKDENKTSLRLTDGDGGAAVKIERNGDTHTGTGNRTAQNGLEVGSLPSHAGIPDSLFITSMDEVQEQQDQLLELMQAAAQERDALKEQVKQLTLQLQEKYSAVCQNTIKKECSPQATQTEQLGLDYKSLFEKANQKVEELIKDKEVLYSRLQSLQEEKENLELKCDELTLSLQQQLQQKQQQQQEEKEQEEDAEERATTSHGASETTMPTAPQDAEEPGPSSDSFRSLIELRHNVGRLLVSYVPALALDQVNYKCSVIDEILEQVLLSNESSSAAEQQMNE
ncbi:LOW QUALITY PROTEIN: MORC family CW-type zinc finger protein 3a [Thalassophryne amazonica]|uniref:LOW QUALITY PROTEIN: MORC family CW-type zinc finger protein 3a n=1 Tax=Thalassophryne amazonica TaxID=390379 RepID=UPI00147108C7|nr:LOW QUALITY PROTEIN: MORC family CW-type zinc finger protein 3a [Thalassophryne amazonica]